MTRKVTTVYRESRVRNSETISLTGEPGGYLVSTEKG